MTNFVAAAAFGLLGVALSGCADKPPAEILLPAASISGGEKTVTVLAAATRERVEGDAYLFTSNRAGAINYQEYAVSIPPNHVVGQRMAFRLSRQCCDPICRGLQPTAHGERFCHGAPDPARFAKGS
jgi:hypothetical protein